MAISKNLPINFSDVTQELWGTVTSGKRLFGTDANNGAFLKANDAFFHPLYKGNKDRLSNFRGYNNAISGYLLIAHINPISAAPWSNITSSSVNQTASTNLNGSRNSIEIMAQSGHTNSAAKLCWDLNVSWYSDWYLGSWGENIYLYNNRVIVNNQITTQSGTILNNSIWSSSEADSTQAWIKNWSSGQQQTVSKTQSYEIRPIRQQYVSNHLLYAIGDYAFGGVVFHKFETNYADTDNETPSYISATLTITEITQTSCRLNWSGFTDNYGISKFVVTGNTYPSGPQIYVSSDLVRTTNTHVVTGLNRNAGYEMRVWAYDNKNNPSGLSETIFTLPLDTPTLTFVSKTSSSITVSWGNITNATSYTREHKLSSSGTWGNATTVTSPSIISGLSENTSYDIRVKANDATSSSAWSNVITQTTTSARSMSIAGDITFDQYGDLCSFSLGQIIITANANWQLTGANASTFNTTSGGSGDTYVSSSSVPSQGSSFKADIIWSSDSAPTEFFVQQTRMGSGEECL